MENHWIWFFVALAFLFGSFFVFLIVKYLHQWSKEEERKELVKKKERQQITQKLGKRCFFCKEKIECSDKYYNSAVKKGEVIPCSSCWKIIQQWKEL